jgi:hypothetical protein
MNLLIFSILNTIFICIETVQADKIKLVSAKELEIKYKSINKNRVNNLDNILTKCSPPETRSVIEFCFKFLNVNIEYLGCACS